MTNPGRVGYRPNIIANPSYVPEGAKHAKIKQAGRWAATLAANILTLGGAYVVARSMQFKERTKAIAEFNDKEAFRSNAPDMLEKFTNWCEGIRDKRLNFICFYKTGKTVGFCNYAPLKKEITETCEVYDTVNRTFTQQEVKFNNVETAFQYTKWSRILKQNHEKIDPADREFIAFKLLGMLAAQAKTDPEPAKVAFTINRELERAFQKETGGKYKELWAKDWKGKEGLTVMLRLLMKKYTQEPYYSALKNTGSAPLVEHNEPARASKGKQIDTWTDGHNGRGLNMLGEELMLVRTLLQQDVLKLGMSNEDINNELELQDEELKHFATKTDKNYLNHQTQLNTMENQAKEINKAIKEGKLDYAPYPKGGVRLPDFFKFLFSKPEVHAEMNAAASASLSQSEESLFKEIPTIEIDRTEFNSNIESSLAVINELLSLHQMKRPLRENFAGKITGIFSQLANLSQYDAIVKASYLSLYKLYFSCSQPPNQTSPEDVAKALEDAKNAIEALRERANSS